MAVIAISRQFGAGGQTLGKRVAKKLGYMLIDSEITKLVAEKAKVTHNWVEHIEREAGGTLLKFMSGVVSKRFIDRLLDESKGYIDEEIYIDVLHDVIKQIAKKDNVVIIGRGAQYILRNYENVKHILLIADREDRIKFMEDHYDISYHQAKKTVKVHEKRRLSLYRKFGKEDYDNPELYHLVIDMSRVNMKRACELVYNLV